MLQGSRTARHDRSRKRSFTAAACGPHGLGVDHPPFRLTGQQLDHFLSFAVAASIAASPSRAGSNGRVSAMKFSQAFESATISFPDPWRKRAKPILIDLDPVAFADLIALVIK